MCEYAVFRPDESGVAAHGTGVGYLTLGDWAASVTVLKRREVPNADPAAYATLRISVVSMVGGGVWSREEEDCWMSYYLDYSLV